MPSMKWLAIGRYTGLSSRWPLVGFDRDLRTPSLSMPKLWILNKSMPSDWALEPLLNESCCSEISILPLSSLPLSHTALLLFSIHLVSLIPYPPPIREHAHMHTSDSSLHPSIFFPLDNPMSDPPVTVLLFACPICVCHSGENCFHIQSQCVFSLDKEKKSQV